MKDNRFLVGVPFLPAGERLHVPSSCRIFAVLPQPAPDGPTDGKNEPISGREKGYQDCTTTVPFIEGWIEQWYGYVPAWANDCENEAPVASWVEVNGTGDPASDAISWGALSSLVQVTVVPVFTVMVAGLNAKFLIVIAFAEAGGTGVAPAGWAGLWPEEQPAERLARSSMTSNAAMKGIRNCTDILA